MRKTNTMKKIQCIINSVNLHFRRKLIKVPQNHYKLLTHKKKVIQNFKQWIQGIMMLAYGQMLKDGQSR